MKVVGLTGGIGSGKTRIAKSFEALGIPIYIADVEAKKLTERSTFIKKKLIALLGPKTYNASGLNRAYVANKIFTNKELLEKVNAIIHPRVGQHFNRWKKKQKDAPYCIKEAAILFENGGYKHCDATILVTAPKEMRIQRVTERDTTSRDAIESRMSNQWEDIEKIPLATYVIENIHWDDTQKAILQIHKKLLKL